MGMQPSIANLAGETNYDPVTGWSPIAREQVVPYGRERVVPYRPRTLGTQSPANGERNTLGTRRELSQPAR